METKMKGKAIIGIAMAAIMVASVFVAMVPTVSAQPAGAMSEIDLDNRPSTVIIGEKLRIYDLVNGSTVSFESTDPDHSFSWTGDATTGNITQDITSAKVKETGYKVKWYNRTAPTVLNEKDAWVYFNAPTFDIEIRDENWDEKVTAVTRSTDVTIYVDTNLPAEDVVNIKVKDPDGYTKTHDTQQVGNLSETGGWKMNTSGFTKTGEYEIWLKTKKANAYGLDMESSTKEKLRIFKPDIKIEAATTTPPTHKDVLFTVTAPPYTWFNFNTTNDKYANLSRDLEDMKDVTDTNFSDTDTLVRFTGKTDENGDFKFVAKFTDDKSFKFDVKATIGTETKDDDITIDVSKAAVIFDIPRTVIIGEKLKITGTVSAGLEVDIAIDDDIRKSKFNDITVSAGEFEVEWDTGEEMPGTVKIKAFIDCDLVQGASESAIKAEDEDGITSVKLIKPGLDAEQPRNVIAEDDDYTIEGTATGVDNGDYVLIGPKGATVSAVNDVAKGILIDSASVSDSEFSEDITMGGSGFDTGIWIVMVLHPGRDGKYGDLRATATADAEAGELAEAFGDANHQVNLKGKDKNQIVAMIEDHTKDVAGSDDLLVRFTFKVESAYVRLNPVEAVAVGEPLNISGVTNREPGTIITISTFAGPSELVVAIVEVEWPTADEGVFTATIDTTDAPAGIYTLEADDGDGNMDTVTVEIVTEVVATPTPTPTAEPTATPTAEPVPTAEPTAEPTPTPTPTPPGFEGVFAIAGLLSIAYLVLRRRK